MRDNMYVWQHRMVDYTFIELCTLQRAARRQRDLMIVDRTALEERILRGGHDGERMQLQNAHRVLDAEISVLQGAIRKNWYAITNRGQSP